jgi:hypothetical protein
MNFPSINRIISDVVSGNGCGGDSDDNIGYISGTGCGDGSCNDSAVSSCNDSDIITGSGYGPGDNDEGKTCRSLRKNE